MLNPSSTYYIQYITNFFSFLTLISPPPATPPLQIASLIGVVFMIGACLSILSHFWHYAEWVGPLGMLFLIVVLFALPLPLLKHKSRIWLSKEMVCTTTVNSRHTGSN